MSQKEFAGLSPQEVAGLTGKDKAAYEKWAAKQNVGDQEDTRSQEEIGADYFESHEVPYDSVYVCEDGTVFYGSMKGKNLADNYSKEKGQDPNTFYKEVRK